MQRQVEQRQHQHADARVVARRLKADGSPASIGTVHNTPCADCTVASTDRQEEVQHDHHS